MPSSSLSNFKIPWGYTRRMLRRRVNSGTFFALSMNQEFYLKSQKIKGGRPLNEHFWEHMIKESPLSKCEPQRMNNWKLNDRIKRRLSETWGITSIMKQPAKIKRALDWLKSDKVRTQQKHRCILPTWWHLSEMTPTPGKRQKELYASIEK